MEKEFVTYNLALRMKALGFDEECLAYFNSKGVLSTKSDEYELYLINNDKWISPACSAPTWQSAFAWFITQIDDEFKVCLGEDGWYIYNLENEVFEGEKALEKLCEIIENKKS